jgi:hypothetical protein
LFVGGGGRHQDLPKGREGEGEIENAAKFEKRRHRERAKDKHGKRKNLKDREWILKKKEVFEVSQPQETSILISIFFLAVSQTRQGRCPTRLEIYGAKSETRLLT